MQELGWVHHGGKLKGKHPSICNNLHIQEIKTSILEYPKKLYSRKPLSPGPHPTPTTSRWSVWFPELGLLGPYLVALASLPNLPKKKNRREKQTTSTFPTYSSFQTKIKYEIKRFHFFLPSFFFFLLLLFFHCCTIFLQGVDYCIHVEEC